MGHRHSTEKLAKFSVIQYQTQQDMYNSIAKKVAGKGKHLILTPTNGLKEDIEKIEGDKKKVFNFWSLLMRVKSPEMQQFCQGQQTQVLKEILDEHRETLPKWVEKIPNIENSFVNLMRARIANIQGSLIEPGFYEAVAEDDWEKWEAGFYKAYCSKIENLDKPFTFQDMVWMLRHESTWEGLLLHEYTDVTICNPNDSLDQPILLYHVFESIFNYAKQVSNDQNWECYVGPPGQELFSDSQATSHSSADIPEEEMIEYVQLYGLKFLWEEIDWAKRIEEAKQEWNQGGENFWKHVKIITERVNLFPDLPEHKKIVDKTWEFHPKRMDKCLKGNHTWRELYKKLIETYKKWPQVKKLRAEVSKIPDLTDQNNNKFINILKNDQYWRDHLEICEKSESIWKEKHGVILPQSEQQKTLEKKAVDYLQRHSLFPRHKTRNHASKAKSTLISIAKKYGRSPRSLLLNFVSSEAMEKVALDDDRDLKVLDEIRAGKGKEVGDSTLKADWENYLDKKMPEYGVSRTAKIKPSHWCRFIPIPVAKELNSVRKDLFVKKYPFPDEWVKNENDQEFSQSFPHCWTEDQLKEWFKKEALDKGVSSVRIPEVNHWEKDKLKRLKDKQLEDFIDKLGSFSSSWIKNEKDLAWENALLSRLSSPALRLLRPDVEKFRVDNDDMFGCYEPEPELVIFDGQAVQDQEIDFSDEEDDDRVKREKIIKKHNKALISKVIERLNKLIEDIETEAITSGPKIAILLPKRILKELKNRLEEESLKVKGIGVRIEMDPVAEETEVIGLISAVFKTWSDNLSNKQILDLLDVDLEYVEHNMKSGKGVFRESTRKVLFDYKMKAEEKLGRSESSWEIKDYESLYPARELLKAANDNGPTSDPVVSAFLQSNPLPTEIAENLLVAIRGYNYPSDYPIPEQYTRIAEFIRSSKWLTSKQIYKRMEDITFSPGRDANYSELKDDGPLVVLSTIAKHRGRINAFDFVVAKINKSNPHVLPKIRAAILEGALEKNIKQTGSFVLKGFLESHREENKSRITSRRSKTEKRGTQVAAKISKTKLAVLKNKSLSSIKSSNSSRNI